MAYEPVFRSEEERKLYELMLNDDFRPHISKAAPDGKVVYKGHVTAEMKERCRRLQAEGKLVIIDGCGDDYNTRTM